MSQPTPTGTPIEPMFHSGTVTTGVVGRPWRASITPWGAVIQWNDVASDAEGTASGPQLNWWVAATDRWHTPSDEPAVRQSRIDATPVTETRVRVPGGDVVQRIYSVPDAGGITIVEFENESTLPVAVALSHRNLLTERPIADVPIEGIELPPDACVLPIGHKASARVGISHRNLVGPQLLSFNVPSAPAVVRGWTSTLERAGRFVLPEGDVYGELVAALGAQRCEIILGAVPAAVDDPAGFAIALDTLVRIGEPPTPWLDELVVAVDALGPDDTWRAAVGLKAAARVLAATDEARGQRDIDRIITRRAKAIRPADAPNQDDIILGPWLEEFVTDGGALFPQGLPATWYGQPVEAHLVPTLVQPAAGGVSQVSFALRWHGENVAILWEQTGAPVTLSAPTLDPAWSSSQVSGEALLVLNRG